MSRGLNWTDLLSQELDYVVLRKSNRLQVRSGKSRFNLQTLPAADFPGLADPGTAQSKMTMPQKASTGPGWQPARHSASGSECPTRR